MRLLILSLFLILVGCDGTLIGSDDSDGGAAADAGGVDNFWDIDAGSLDAGDGDGDGDGDKDGGKPDEDKPDGGGPDEEAIELWEGVVDTAAGTGTMSLTFTNDDQSESCALSYPISGLSSLDDCTFCTFAWTMTLGPVTITEETGAACTGHDEREGETLQYGQSEVSIGSFNGTDYFELGENAGSGWVVAPDGYSSFKEANTTWTFGLK